MALRKKKTVRDQLESRLEDALAQAEVLRQQVVDRAPGVRDSVLEKVEHGVADLRERLPELRDDLLERVPELDEKTYDKLPAGVTDRLPERVKPKKKRLRKIVGIGLIAGAAAAIVANLRGSQAPPPPPPASTYPRPAPAPAAPAAATESTEEPPVGGPDGKVAPA